MSIRKPSVLFALGLVTILGACGGESQQPAGPGATQAAAPAAPAATSGTASVSGRILFEGTVPPAEKVKTSADPKCQAMNPNGLEKQTIKVKEGGLAEVVVYVKNVSGAYPAPATAVTLDQSGCTYQPHVVAMQAGQTLTIKNSDDTLHNIHPRPTVNAEFNIGQPRKGMETSKAFFDKAEVMIPVGCDVHPWMRSYIAVFTHPFFVVTGEGGSFEIKGLPAGEYEIEAVHEKLKAVSGKVTVKDGEAGKLDLTYKS
ncbi:MAG: TonB-dependent receptor [Acidobacteria bacterium]|nr:TonB-dependent receptor [Acidobacteriota bacterium]